MKLRNSAVKSNLFFGGGSALSSSTSESVSLYGLPHSGQEDRLLFPCAFETEWSTGAPQCGQAVALSETFPPHSEHLRSMLSPERYLEGMTSSRIMDGFCGGVSVSSCSALKLLTGGVRTSVPVPVRW